MDTSSTFLFFFDLSQHSIYMQCQTVLASLLVLTWFNIPYQWPVIFVT